MITAFECSQCGSTEFEEVKTRQVRCAHCGSLFQVVTSEPLLVINKGANVIFGKNANVEIHGDIEVENGANVEILGKVTVLKGNQKKDFRLKLIRDGSEK
jgi:uncharacterized Zn finger protein